MERWSGDQETTSAHLIHLIHTHITFENTEVRAIYIGTVFVCSMNLDSRVHCSEEALSPTWDIFHVEHTHTTTTLLQTLMHTTTEYMWEKGTHNIGCFS